MTKNQAAGKRIGPVLAFIMPTGALILFNAFPEQVGYLQRAADSDSLVPFLGPAFTALLPWLNVWWSVVLVAAVVRLVGAHNRTLLPWIELGASVMGIYLLGRMILGPTLVALDPNWTATASPAATSEAAAFMPWLAATFDLGLVVALIACGITGGRRLYRSLGGEVWKTLLVAIVVLGLALAQAEGWTLPTGLGVALAMAAGLGIGLARAGLTAHGYGRLPVRGFWRRMVMENGGRPMGEAPALNEIDGRQ